MTRVTVVGGGLAGCEASIQLARRGHDVTLLEQKPLARTPAQTGDYLAKELANYKGYQGELGSRLK